MEQHGISKLDLKRQNRMQVLKILKQRGPTSRIDIAAMLELTRAAVTIITNEMIEQGIILEVGEYKHLTEKAPRGRKKILIDINHNYKFILGFVVEDDIVSVGLSTLSGDVLDKRNMEITKRISFDEISNFAIKSAKDIMHYNCLEKSDILGVGIGVIPSMFDILNIKVENKVANYSGLKEYYSKITDLPIVIDNSVKGTAMANIDFQKEKNTQTHTIAFLQLGGVFHFVVTNLNDPIKSYDNRTAFVNNLIIKPDARESFVEGYNPGSVCSEISNIGIVEKAKRVYGIKTTPDLYKYTNGDINAVTFSTIKKIRTDEPIDALLKEISRLMAVLVNNLIYSTNPQKLVLHHFIQPEIDFKKLHHEMEKLSGLPLAEMIEMSIIDPQNRFLSGCALAIRELFFTRGGFDFFEQ